MFPYYFLCKYACSHNYADDMTALVYYGHRVALSKVEFNDLFAHLLKKNLVAKLASGQSGQAALPPDRQVCCQGYVRTWEIWRQVL